MLSGLFAGLAGVLYAVQNEFAAPDFVYFLTSGDTVIYNVIGGIGTLVGPIVGAGFFQLLRELLSRMFGDQFPYLIPLGIIFIVMIIFLPQGLLGFARRWLNRLSGRARRPQLPAGFLPRNSASAVTSFLSPSKSSAMRS